MLYVCARRVPHLFILGVLASASACLPPAVPDGDQSQVNDDAFPLTEFGYSIALTVGNKILFTGGQYNGSVGNVDIFDAASGKWSTEKISVPRNAMGGAVIGSSAYFVGGVKTEVSGESDLVDVYDSPSGAWTTIHLSVPRSGPGVVAIGSKLIVAGGLYAFNTDNPISGAGTNSLSSIEVIDVVSGARTTAALSRPRAGLAAVTTGGKAYFIGGRACPYDYVAACDASNTIDVFDPTTRSVSSIEMPHRRKNHSAVAVGAVIVIAGGDAFSGNTDVLDAYDTSTGEWITMPTPSIGAGSTAVAIGSDAIFAGGFTNQRVVTRYNVLGEYLDTTESLKYRRYNMAGAAWNGLAYFGGGVTSPQERSKTIEIIRPLAISSQGPIYSSYKFVAYTTADGRAPQGRYGFWFSQGWTDAEAESGAFAVLKDVFATSETFRASELQEIDLYRPDICGSGWTLLRGPNDIKISSARLGTRNSYVSPEGNVLGTFDYSMNLRCGR